ncbi:hypothetical protein PsAD46_01337 [Pseudovibrio sp. Ad46]|nr:hypothetical protein PsAD46_01337 [Pseudovibrio sp. Ad46]KZK98915.1 hypothetical protein PsAD5_01538 [Pseudovibrio sp. Ad5]
MTFLPFAASIYDSYELYVSWSRISRWFLVISIFTILIPSYLFPRIIAASSFDFLIPYIHAFPLLADRFYVLKSINELSSYQYLISSSTSLVSIIPLAAILSMSYLRLCSDKKINIGMAMLSILSIFLFLSSTYVLLFFNPNFSVSNYLGTFYLFVGYPYPILCVAYAFFFSAALSQPIIFCVKLLKLVKWVSHD